MKKTLTNNIGLKIMSILFAILLWLFVVNIDDPVTTKVYRNIAVSVVHDEIIINRGQTYSFVNNVNTVSVTVRAKRSVLDDIQAEDIKAVADVREIQLKSLIPVTITIPKYEGDYEDVSVSPKNIEILLANSTTRKFPVAVTTVGSLRDGYALGETVADPQRVEITGPDSTINRIERAVAKVDISGLSEDATLPAELILYDEQNNVIDQKMLSTNIGNKDVSVSVHLLNTKTVPLEFRTSGITPADGYVFSGITTEPQSIQIVGTKEDLEDLDKIEMPVSALVLDDVSEKTDIVVDITPYLPADVTLADPQASNVAVTVAVEKAGTKTIEIPIKSISVNNLAENLKIDYGTTQTVELHFRGTEEALNGLGSIAPSIELNNYKQEGSYDVPVQVVNLPAGCTMEEVAVVHITLEKK